MVTIKLEDNYYIVVVQGKEISKQKTLIKASEKLYKYLKGQQWQNKAIRKRLLLI
jgi:hypothetical protein